MQAKNKIISLIMVMVMAFGGSLTLAGKENIVFNQSKDEINNPFQGFYIQLDSANYNAFYKEIEDNDVNLVMLSFNLSGCTQKELPKQKLEELEVALKTLEELDAQIIFRAAYGFDEGYRTTEPRIFNIVLEHINQIAQILNFYESNILCVQAGMLGPWGEWHSSGFFTDIQTATRVRNEIALQWDKQLNKQIQLQLRTPQYIKNAIEAGIPAKRLGFHNDALLSSKDDLRTYLVRSDDIDWVQQKLSHSKTGGETALVNGYCAIENAVKEFNIIGLTYLNKKYNTQVLNLWRDVDYLDINGYEYIQNHLGLRLYLDRAVLPRQISRFNGNIALSVTNSGFADYVDEVEFKIVIKNMGNIKYISPKAKTKRDKVMLNANVLKELEDGISEIGLAARYRSKNFSFANEKQFISDDIVYFAKYEKDKSFCLIV